MTSDGELDWLFWTLGGVLAVSGAAVAAWALLWDRAKRRGVVRRRCPRCWYDMTGVPGVTCPECGRSARHERRLAATRRRWRWAAVASAACLVGVVLLATPLFRGDDWVRHVPSFVLVLIAPGEAPGTSAQGRSNALAMTTRIQRSGLSWNTTLAQRRALPSAPKALGERFDDEGWRRLLDGKLAHWQSQMFLDRYFRNCAPQTPWSLEFPERWPIQKAVPARLSSKLRAPLPDLITIELWIGDDTPERPFNRHALRNGLATLLEGSPRLGHENRVQIRLWAGDTIVYACRETLPVQIVGSAQELMTPARGTETTDAVRAGLAARLSEGDAPLLYVRHTTNAAPRNADGLAVVVRAEVIAGEELIAHSHTWVQLFNDHRVSPRVVPLQWLPGGLDQARRVPDQCAVRIVGELDLATRMYFQWPSRARPPADTGTARSRSRSPCRIPPHPELHHSSDSAVRPSTVAERCPGRPTPSGRLEVDLTRVLDPGGCVENLDRNECAGLVIVQNDPRLSLVTLGDGTTLEYDAQRVGLSVVRHGHEELQYLLILLVR